LAGQQGWAGVPAALKESAQASMGLATSIASSSVAKTILAEALILIFHFYICT